MPKFASDAKAFDYLRLLVLGPPKIGKTQTIISTAPKPVYVILSDAESDLRPAARVCGPKDFAYDEVNSTRGDVLLRQAESAWKEASEGAKAGRYKSIVWDTLTSFATYLINAELAASTNDKGNEVPQTAYPSYGRRVKNYIGRLVSSAVPAHVIVISHDVKESKELPGQLAKHGVGIVPGIEGSVRGQIARYFQDVVYMEKRKETGAERRVFITSMEGVYGIGCRSLPNHAEVPADITEFYKLAVGKGDPKPKLSTGGKSSIVKPPVKTGVKPSIARK
jgi:hypothetical protein